MSIEINAKSSVVGMPTQWVAAGLARVLGAQAGELRPRNRANHLGLELAPFGCCWQSWGF